MMRSIVAQEHGNGCRGDDDVANPAESIGNLTEDEIAENCRKDNLAIVIDGNFSGGGVGIGNAGTQAAEQTNQRREACQIGGGRLDDEQRTDKSGNHTKSLKEIDSFL